MNVHGERLSSVELLRFSPEQLAAHWTEVRDADAAYDLRGWYHELYQEFMRGKKVLDVGCGFGISSITFAQFGARVTFADIVETNVLLCQKVCKGLGIKADFAVINSLDDLKSLPSDFDAITAIGSLHNAPFDFLKAETAELVKHLKIGGRWLQFAYPVSRWQREGCLAFDKWGDITDGGSPWQEPYDLPRLLRLLDPAKFIPIFYYEWHNQDFNWFDLKLIESNPAANT